MQRFHLHLGCYALILVAVSLTGAAGAGDKKKDGAGFPGPKRGPEHKILESLAGTFEAKVKIFDGPAKPPIVSTGMMTRKMILDGNYLQESFKGDFRGQTFTGMGIVSYDATKKQYVTAWCDSMSTSIMMMHGKYDADKKTLTTFGQDMEPASGKKMKSRDVLKIVSADEQFFEMYRQAEGSDKEFKVMEISYLRKSGAKK